MSSSTKAKKHSPKAPGEALERIQELERSLRDHVERLRYANEQLVSLTRISGRFQQIRDEVTLVEEAPRLLTRTLDFDRASFSLREDGELRVKAFWFERDSEATIAAFRDLVNSGKLAVPEAMKESFSSNKTIFIPDIAADGRWPLEDARKQGIEEIVVAPVTVEGQPVGVLVGNMVHHKREMDEQDVARFEIFANMVGLALENIRGYSTLRRQVEERTESLQSVVQELHSKAAELQKKTISLGKANVELLSMKEELEAKNEQIRKADEQLRTIVEASPIPFVVSRFSDGEVIYANEPLGEIVGMPVSEMIGRKTPEFYVDQKDREDALQKLRDGGQLDQHEVRIRRADGQEIWIMYTLVLAELAGEQVIVGGMHDITLRRESEDALRRSEAALRQAHNSMELRVKERTAELAALNRDLRQSESKNRALINALPDLMFRLDRGGIYLDFKCPQDSDLPLSPENTIGKSIDEILPSELAGRMRSRVSEVLGSGEPRLMEYEMDHDGHTHHFEARMVQSGENEVLAIVREITERKRAEASLRQAHEELEQRVDERTAELARTNKELREAQSQLVQSEKMAALGMLVAGIAHEINTPVGAINSMHDTQVRALKKLRAILESDLNITLEEIPRLAATIKVIEDAMNVIASGSERVTRIVKRLRSFARLDEAELKEVDLHEGIDDTLVIIHHEIKHRLNVVREYGELPTIACFPGRLNQVFLNLLINANQAIREKGTVTIRTWHRDGFVHVRISDDGVGIPQHNLKKIFDPGFTTKGVGVGTGLGLSIVYRIVHEDHRGTITVESGEGKGAAFTVSIPDNLDEILENT